MVEAMEYRGWWASLYFITVFVWGSWVLVNMFTAILIEAFYNEQRRNKARYVRFPPAIACRPSARGFWPIVLERRAAGDDWSIGVGPNNCETTAQCHRLSVRCNGAMSVAQHSAKWGVLFVFGCSTLGHYCYHSPETENCRQYSSRISLSQHPFGFATQSTFRR